MRVFKTIIWGVAILFSVAVVALVGWLAFAPPDLIRVGTGYSAKIVCSNVFLAARDPEEVLAVDVQAPGHPLLGYISVDVDRDAETVSAALFGLFGESIAVHREGLGCASVPDGEIERAPALGASAEVAPVPRDDDAIWPAGEMVEPSRDPVIAEILDDSEMTGPGMRAVVVVQDGHIVGERYGEGFTPETPLLGWSMTKTVTAAILGTLEDRIGRDDATLRAGWTDARGQITTADLMAMSSGLEFNEDYGDVTDVTRMLYLEPDMAQFAGDKPLAETRGESFSYSSGTTVLLSRLWQDRFDDPQEALGWPRRALFGPLGMDSAVLETDARGTFVGSSYLYATARDWARLGQFLLQDGMWNGAQLMPEGYVDWMREPAPASDGVYGRGQVWLAGPERGPQAELPEDTYWLRGHDGQSMAIVPSRDLIVLRLGLTPSGLDYSPAPMIAALVAAVE